MLQANIGDTQGSHINQIGMKICVDCLCHRKIKKENIDHQSLLINKADKIMHLEAMTIAILL